MSPELVMVDPDLRTCARAAMVVPYVVREPIAAAPPEAPVASPPARRSALAVSAGALLAAAVTGFSVLAAALGGTEPAAGPKSAPIAGVAVAKTAVPSKQGSSVMKEGAGVVRNASSQEGVTLNTGAEQRDPQRPPYDEIASSSPSSAPRPLVGGASVLAWDPVADAPAYEVELVRDGALIHSAASETPSISLPRTWNYAGASFALQPEDQLYVWPVVDGRRGRPVVDGRLALELTPVALATTPATTRESPGR